MSAKSSVACSRCTNTFLEDLNFYALENLGYMSSSACSGCRFFVNVAQRYKRDTADDAQTQLLMRRPSKDSNLVDIYHVRNNDEDTSITMSYKLRLGATSGMYPTQDPSQ
jgi:hypothetical protein